MSPFRVKGNDITMISCDSLSSVFSKIISACKAAVCSVIVSYREEDAFEVHGRNLVNQVRDASVIHILSPMVRQIREMNSRIPKRRKTTLDATGNITVDQFRFPFDEWSHIVPRTITMMKAAVSELSEGSWWELVVDMTTDLRVDVNERTGDLLLAGVKTAWKEARSFHLNAFDTFQAQIEMAFHGFGGGSARMTELVDPTMNHCLFVNDTIYYSLKSLKVYNHASRKFKEVERKLPPIIGRYFLLFRSIVQTYPTLFKEGDATLIFPSRDGRSKVGVSHVIRDIFVLETLPGMTQIRQFWAGVSNFVTGIDRPSQYLTSNDMGSSKMGHSSNTHAATYSSERVGVDESHFKSYHMAIGDTSYDIAKNQCALSLVHIRQAMRLRHPNSIALRRRPHFGYVFLHG